jgi:inner membrane protein
MGGVMATIYTHAVVGLGLARLYTSRRMPWPYWALAAFLPIVPDFDAFSTAPYDNYTALGHRGLTHSLLFALWVGAFAASLTFRRFGMSFWALSGLFFVIIASHGLLDALTRGGGKIPFLWPLTGRYGNWGPIPVADIAMEWPDPRRSRAIRSELLWVWLPTAGLVAAVTVYRLLRARRPTTAA